MIKLIIFDLDGVLIDTEKLHSESKLEILKSFDIYYTENITEYIGVSNIDFWEKMRKEYGILETAISLEKMQYDYIVDKMTAITMSASSYLYDLLNWIKKRNYKIALCSSSKRYFVDKVLEYLEVTGYFDRIVCGDDAQKVKPSGELYLKVMSLFRDIKKEEIISIEDSYSGATASLSAKIKCIGYRNVTSGNQDLSKCCAICDNLKDIKKIIGDYDGKSR